MSFLMKTRVQILLEAADSNPSEEADKYTELKLGLWY
jgi:hypothetical protein